MGPAQIPPAPPHPAHPAHSPAAGVRGVTAAADRQVCDAHEAVPVLVVLDVGVHQLELLRELPQKHQEGRGKVDQFLELELNAH